VKIEELVPSLELCQKMMDAGFPQGTYFAWGLSLVNDSTMLLDTREKWENVVEPFIVAAPTVSEIGLRLPLEVGTCFDGQGWYAFMMNRMGFDWKQIMGTGAATEADSRALAWLHLAGKGER
jgi:hypothetical protein